MELDRAFVINGDDLRVALADDGGHPALVSNPRDVAEYILGRIAQPAGKAGIRVTEGSIASALEGFTLIGRPVTDPGDTVQVDVDDPDAFAKALFAALCRMAALREPDGGSAVAGPAQTGAEDVELSFLAECIRHLDAMGDLAAGRCMAYLADRYPPE